MKNQLPMEIKSRIRQLRFYRNMEFFNGNLLLCFTAAMFTPSYNRFGDKFDILNAKIKNLKNGLDEDDGFNLENYSEPGITDNPKLFPQLVKNKNNIKTEEKTTTTNTNELKSEAMKVVHKKQIVDQYYEFQGLSIREKIERLEFEKNKLLNLQNNIEDQQLTEEKIKKNKRNEYLR